MNSHSPLAALEIRATEDGQLQVALADSERVLILTLVARDAKRWADSVALVLRARTISKRVPKEWTVMVEEPGLQAGSLILTRRDGEVGSRWTLSVADREFDQIRMTVDPGEVRALLAAMRRQVDAAVRPVPGRAKQRQRARVPSSIPKPTTPR